jgi:hypothetical protein
MQAENLRLEAAKIDNERNEVESDADCGGCTNGGGGEDLENRQEQHGLENSLMNLREQRLISCTCDVFCDGRTLWDFGGRTWWLTMILVADA